MALTRVTASDIATNGVQAILTDSPVGSATEVKLLFDKLATFVATTMNANSTALEKDTTTSGAEQIGCSAITGVNSGVKGNIREMLVSLKALIDGVAVAGLSTNSIDESYLTTSAVMLSLLTGYSIAGTASALSSSDTVKVALGKLEKYISNILDGTLGANKASDYVAGGAIATALAAKQATLTYDSTPTLASTNPVTSNGIAVSIATKKALDKALGFGFPQTLLGGETNQYDITAGTVVAAGNKIEVNWSINSKYSHSDTFIVKEISGTEIISISKVVYNASGVVSIYSFNVRFVSSTRVQFTNAQLTTISASGTVTKAGSSAITIDSMYVIAR